MSPVHTTQGLLSKWEFSQWCRPVDGPRVAMASTPLLTMWDSKWVPKIKPFPKSLLAKLNMWVNLFAQKSPPSLCGLAPNHLPRGRQSTPSNTKGTLQQVRTNMLKLTLDCLTLIFLFFYSLAPSLLCEICNSWYTNHPKYNVLLLKGMP